MMQLKRMSAIFLTVAVMVSCVMINTYAGDDKSGYSLTALNESAAGVDPESKFLFSVPGEMSASDVEEALSVDGEATPEAVQNGEREFIIVPSTPLAPNKLYKFRLKLLSGEELTWVFQTAAKFQITSAMPADKATSVPVNSGIEITFSDENYTDINDLFTISPNAGGSFERHGKTVSFVPDSPLDYKTIYTVELKSGIKNTVTGAEIDKDYIFEFETESMDETETKPKGYIGFYSEYFEQPASYNPEIGLYIYGKEKVEPEITLYRFDDRREAVETVKKITGLPSWSRFNYDNFSAEGLKLSEIASFNAGDSYDSYNGVLTLPAKYPQGMYLIRAEADGEYSYAILQLTDLPVQIIGDEDRTVFWVNDIENGKAAKGVKIRSIDNGEVYITNENGIAEAETINEETFFEITAPDGRESLITPCLNNSMAGHREKDKYYTALQLDRPLYKPDDIVSFWGVVKDRQKSENDGYITAVLTRGYYGSDVLQKQTAEVKNGIYSGEMELAGLDSGSYYLKIYKGTDISEDGGVLDSTYISVKNFVKPAYKLEVTADKKAVFAGDGVTFNIAAGFFEGTPVADLDVSYKSGFYNTGETKTAKTDRGGNISIAETPVNNEKQGEDIFSLSAEATLPEMGIISGKSNVRVFFNDIDVSACASRDKRDAKLSVNVNSITLDRINSGTAENYNDYRDKPVGGRELNVNIYRKYWVKEQDGQYYDYIEKKTVPYYRYKTEEEKIDSFKMETNESGAAEKKFKLPDNQNECYYVKISCKDLSGRDIELERYIGRDYSDLYINDYYLDGAGESYNAGDKAELTLCRGTEEVKKGGFLFVSLKDGILDYQCGSNKYSMIFDDKNIPNTYVYAYYFNGREYVSNYGMRKNLYYNCENSRLSIDVKADKTSYKPGEQCNLIVAVKDINGAAKRADINISVVDEALFELEEYKADTLEALYKPVGNGLVIESGRGTERIYSGGGGGASNLAPGEADNESAKDMGGELGIREEFKDTAVFASLSTDENGTAAYSFTLPDNITSWCAAVSAVSDDYDGGNQTVNINVTEPMFLNYTLNSTFLVGDVPVIGVNVYGSGIGSNETVMFEVWDEANPGAKYTAAGKAFERVNIPLWQMSETGEHSLIISAVTSGGLSDAVKHEYTVSATYQSADKAIYYDVTPGTKFETAETGLSKIIFTDGGRGRFLYELHNIRNNKGARVEKEAASFEADRLIKEYFPDVLTAGKDKEMDIAEYLNSDGGISILPYAESDLETTVKLMTYIIDEIDKDGLTDYLYKAYKGENSENKTLALYGLAMLGEPVLVDLNNYSGLDSLHADDYINLALAYEVLGDADSASRIYDEKILPYVEQIGETSRVNVGSNNDDILGTTSHALQLALRLQKAERDGMYKYCISNYTDDVLISLEKLAYIKEKIKNAADGAGITYELYGEVCTHELDYGKSYALSIPNKNMDAFKIIETEGSVGAVSIVPTEIDKSKADSSVTVLRRYYKANDLNQSTETFKQGDLVRVNLWIDYSAKAFDGSYSVTDYLPAGLAFVNGSAKADPDNSPAYFYCRSKADGQKVTFYDYNGFFNSGRLYYYYARVISPGTFTAEGTLVQNLSERGFFTLGENETVIIEP